MNFCFCKLIVETSGSKHSLLSERKAVHGQGWGVVHCDMKH